MRMDRSSVIILDAEVAGFGEFSYCVSEAAVEEHERVLAVTHHTVYRCSVRSATSALVIPRGQSRSTNMRYPSSSDGES